MSLATSQEHDELRSFVRDFMSTRFDEPAVRRMMDDPLGHDPSVWAQMAGQLGLPGLAIPEPFGGSGAGLTELAIVFEETGRHLAAAPLLGTSMAAQALQASGDPSVGQDLAALAAGTIGSFAWLDERGRDRAHLSRDGDRVSGVLSFAPDANAAELIVVADSSRGAEILLAVDAHDEGVTVEPLITIDPTRRWSLVRLDGARCRPIGDVGEGRSTLDDVLDRTSTLVSAELVGVAERALELSVEYAQVREQFGRPIGSFQAIKHLCADMFVQVEAARSAVRYAVWCADEKPAELPMAAAIAKSYCSEAASAVTETAIQVHGGIGFTWEHPAHLYFKRAKSGELLFGTPSEHLERIATLIGMQ